MKFTIYQFQRLMGKETQNIKNSNLLKKISYIQKTQCIWQVIQKECRPRLKPLLPIKC